MTKAGVYEAGDIYISPEGTKYRAYNAATDGSGCYVCDDGTHQCAFLKTGKCPKCHSDIFGLMDYVGSRVIFLKV